MARDAGTLASDHYEKNMAPWRFAAREKLVHLVRHETVILAKLQKVARRPWLDVYFAWSANLGTHTFYLVMLPMFFWSVKQEMGLDVVWVLALGVYLGGLFKDMFCLPRPLSPPLTRLSMSTSAALEYGFPSTHSCNAVSVAMVFWKHSPSTTVHVLNLALILTLVCGRIYNGMHGFIDVIGGCILGVVCYYIREFVIPYTSNTDVFSALMFTLVALLAVYACPEPVDDCPCFDDSVAFTGVLLGFCWSAVGNSRRLTFPPLPKGNAYYGYLLVRVLLGVPSVILWRAVSKRILLRVLPPVWRLLLSLGLEHPRKYFVSASEYTKLYPRDVPDESVPDDPAQITKMIRRARYAHRDSVSIGPQSAADVYESMANKPSEDLDTELQHIRKPRVRYDVEVVMRLIVYAGIPFIGAVVLSKVCYALGV